MNACATPRGAKKKPPVLLALDVGEELSVEDVYRLVGARVQCIGVRLPRSMLWLSLESPRPDKDSLPLRQGRAIKWIEDALAPLHGRLDERELHRLALAIRAAIGIEPFVWLTDVGGLAREDAADVMRSTARTLLRAALARAGDGDR
jgi:hypothetical protein